MTNRSTTSTSYSTAPNVPSTIYTTASTATSRGGTVYKRRTTISFNKQEEVIIMSPNSNQANASTNAAAVEEECPYQELRWNHAPLFLNDNFDSPDELLKNNKQTLPIHAGRTALLVVDVQPEYWSQCPAVREDFPDFPENLRRLVKECRQKKAKIIWVRADYRYAHSPWLVQFARLHKGRIPSEVHSNPTTDDIQWEEFATPDGGEYVIPKTSWSSTRHTALMDLLKQSGIDTVLVCGLITSVCVQHSAFGIFEAGYRTLLVTDACADRGRARHEAALALYGDYMYELLTVDDLCQPENPFYLQPAKPVWLTPESVDNLVQPQFFNALQDSVVTKTSFLADMDDSRTATTSNKGEHPTFYKVSSNDIQKEEPSSSRPLKAMGGTLRTSASSLSTLSTPLHEIDASPVCVSEAPQQLPPDAIEV